MSFKILLRTLCTMLAVVLTLMLAIAARPAAAATTLLSLGINTNVLALCSLTGGSVPFGTYSGAQLDQTGTVTVSCILGVPFTISLDAGAGTGATTAVRKMTGSNGGLLNYALYRDPGYSAVWGNTAGTNTVTGSGLGVSTANTLTVYGRIPASQTPIAGAYTDTVTVTLTY
jgi:spore coat protein U-like protein